MNTCRTCAALTGECCAEFAARDRDDALGCKQRGLCMALDARAATVLPERACLPSTKEKLNLRLRIWPD